MDQETLQDDQGQWHASVGRSLKPDPTGFYTPECQCGWLGSPIPSLEIAVDALMEHARFRGIVDLAQHLANEAGNKGALGTYGVPKRIRAEVNEP